MTVNLLMGLFEGREQAMAYWQCKLEAMQHLELCEFFKRYNHISGNQNRSDLVLNTIVTKTHLVDVDRLQEWFESDFHNIFFIDNERKDQNKTLPEAYCSTNTYANVLCLEYNDPQYTDEASLRRVVRYVKNEIRTAFPYFANAEMKEEEAVQRLLDMAKAYAEFGQTNKKGRHQNRYGIGGGSASHHTLDQ